jgi:hypothetical protein
MAGRKKVPAKKKSARRKKDAAAKVAATKAPKLSPLLRSAFEVLDHGLWHFFRSTTTADMKFAVLHVDQAVELVLKERVRSGGHSIYKNPKETITIWGAYDILETKLGCTVAERPDLELLHEERNNIQHKYANPSSEDAAFHIDRAVSFLDRFVRDELKIELSDYITSEYLEKVLDSE